jgi:predicted nuclease with TOPRIM domain
MTKFDVFRGSPFAEREKQIEEQQQKQSEEQKQIKILSNENNKLQEQVKQLQYRVEQSRKEFEGLEQKSQDKLRQSKQTIESLKTHIASVQEAKTRDTDFIRIRVNKDIKKQLKRIAPAHNISALIKDLINKYLLIGIQRDTSDKKDEGTR